MADDTHTPHPSTGPEVKTIRWCSWHDDVSDDTALIRAVEECSGPPYPLYACAPCRAQYRLVPLADRPS